MGKRKIKRTLKRFGFDKSFIISTIIILLLFGGIVLYNKVLTPQINLKGKKIVTINYKSDYKDAGFKATQFGDDITKKVKVTGKVNTKKLGDYEITYKIGNGILGKTITRRVRVADIEKPKIKMNKDNIYICPGAKVKYEKKVKATDNYDGDISKKVKVSYDEKESIVTYTVTDSSGNKKEVKKKVLFEDIEKPTIELIGSEYKNVYIGDNYQEEGVKANDNCDGDISSSYTTEGEVNTSALGEYKLTYKVQDKAKNEATITRTVRVIERNKNGVIYLTFDDGPQEGTTNVILDILKEEGVPATFFVTCKGPDYLIKREYDEGHTVALHTCSHDYAGIYSSDDAFFNDLYAVQNRVKNITGYESKISRFPGGSSNTVSRRYSWGIMSRLTVEVQNRGFRYYDWNLSSGDAAGGYPTSDQIYNNVVNSLRKNRANMVLMHDIKPYTRDALRGIIRYGKENGYRFEKITMDTEMVTQRVNN